MTTATFLSVCLLLGVFVPLASFVFLVFFGTRLPGDGGGPAHGHDNHGHDPHEGGHGHGGDAHAEHDAAQGHGHGHFPPKVRRVPKGNPTAGYVATAAIAFSLVMASIVLFTWAGKSATAERAALTAEAAQNAVVWAKLGSVPIEFGVKLDSLTIIMFFMVTLCATCIHVFSLGYMKHDSRFPRFFTYLSLFCFSMLGLLISLNILFMFIFWELVGVCSYFLIGFWFEKKSASNAAMKAFITNRVGDFGFLIGMMLCFTYLGTLSLDSSAIQFKAAAMAAAIGDPSRGVELFTTTFWGVNLATWMGVGLFCGAVGKSAQVPLQVWLPDAMEGPTPVSALIHAATMVAAGVYLVGRIYSLLTPEAQMVIAVIGCITLTMAALIATVQTDIKRVLAYSTLSQLGYMIYGMGVGAWIGALFHLLTHAFFKAMLFLGSGQVIEACHHEQDMRRMGGLWKKLPVTGWTFFIAVLAISGAGIPLTSIGLGGFFSKDEILAVAYYRHHAWNEMHHAQAADAASTPFGPRVALAAQHDDETQRPSQPGERADETSVIPVARGAHAVSDKHAEAASGHHGTNYAALFPGVSQLPWWLYFLPILVAYITPFYMGRCFIMTFLGKPRDRHIYDHAHESRIMTTPLVVLAFMTVVSGFLLFRDYVAGSAPSPQLIPMIDGHDHAIHAIHGALAMRVGIAFVIGLGVAWLVYRNGLELAAAFAALPGVRFLYKLFWNKFYFDHVYDAVLVGGTRIIATISALFDAWIIDGLVNLAGYLTKGFSFFTGLVLDNKGVDGAVNGTGKLAWFLGGAFGGTHTGVIRNYVLLAAILVTGVLIGLWNVTLAVAYVLLGACLVARPTFFFNVAAPIAVAALAVRVLRIVAVGFGRTGDLSAWDWDQLTGFWSAYVRTQVGLYELLFLLIVFAGLQLRYRLGRTQDAEPEWAAG